MKILSTNGWKRKYKKQFMSLFLLGIFSYYRLLLSRSHLFTVPVLYERIARKRTLFYIFWREFPHLNFLNVWKALKNTTPKTPPNYCNAIHMNIRAFQRGTTRYKLLRNAHHQSLRISVPRGHVSFPHGFNLELKAPKESFFIIEMVVS